MHAILERIFDTTNLAQHPDIRQKITGSASRTQPQRAIGTDGRLRQRGREAMPHTVAFVVFGFNMEA